MKHSFLSLSVALVVAVAMLASCGKNSKEYKQLQQQYDSVSSVYQTQINEMDSTISLIINNFQEINEMEGLIKVDRLKGDVEQSQRMRVEDNMMMISERLKKNREEIKNLNNKLAGLNASSRKTIAALEAQLNKKEKEILRLSEELKMKDVKIALLDSMITDLNQNVEANTQTISQQQETIAQQDAAINEVHYCVGTMADLKDMGIVHKGEINTKSFNESYFTKVDMRKFDNLALYSKRADLLTTHPEGSYSLEKGADGQLTLRIVDVAKFWSLSKILVVRVY